MSRGRGRRVAAAFWTSALAGALVGSNFTEGISSQSMQQGGMGLILTVLIVSTPPMAAMFFQGTLGHFSSYSQMGGQPSPSAASAQVGYRVVPTMVSSEPGVERMHSPGYTAPLPGFASATPMPSLPGQRGIASGERMP